jgi:hypothetical protein
MKANKSTVGSASDKPVMYALGLVAAKRADIPDVGRAVLFDIHYPRHPPAADPAPASSFR